MYACGIADVECTCAAPCLQAVYKLNKVIIFVFFVHKKYYGEHHDVYQLRVQTPAVHPHAGHQTGSTKD